MPSLDHRDRTSPASRPSNDDLQHTLVPRCHSRGVDDLRYTYSHHFGFVVATTRWTAMRYAWYPALVRVSTAGVSALVGQQEPALEGEENAHKVPWQWRGDRLRQVGVQRDQPDTRS